MLVVGFVVDKLADSEDVIMDAATEPRRQFIREERPLTTTSAGDIDKYSTIKAFEKTVAEGNVNKFRIRSSVSNSLFSCTYHKIFAVVLAQ